jgi:multidrug resistance efflux pump
MRWQLEAAIAIALLAALPPAGAVVLTGEVRSSGAQGIYTPPSMSSPVVLRTYVPDGTVVKKGDALLSIDAGSMASQLHQLRDQIAQDKDKTIKDVDDLQLKVIDAELALVDAKAASDEAAIDASIPENLIAAAEYDKHQGTYKSDQRDVTLKQEQLAAAQAAVARRRTDGVLQEKKATLQLGFYQSWVDHATVHADMDGVVVHAFEGDNSFDHGTRFEQGSTSYPGTKVGEVVAIGGREVRAWALEPDRRGLRVGERVHLHFDALPAAHATGTIRSISGASEPKPEWGDGRYFALDIAIDGDTTSLHLLPGMSVRVDTATDAPPADAAINPPATIHADGEVQALDSVSIIPPQVEGLWQMNVTRMAADGAQVKKGEPIVTFAAGDLAQKLPATMSQLTEKIRTRDNLKLQLADRARTDTLAVAKAAADAQKAARKTTIPKDAVALMEYKKLWIERRKAERRLALTQQRAKVDADARAAEQRVADGDVSRLQAQVAKMQSELASLTVTAPRAGVFLHHTSWSGDMIDTGSQVWRGMSVGEIPDMQTLVVRASLPERDLEWVHVGQRAQVVLTGGGNRILTGRIAQIGTTVHSESRVQPVPVVDLQITLDAHAAKLKPGQPVQVDIKAASGGKA